MGKPYIYNNKKGSRKAAFFVVINLITEVWQQHCLLYLKLPQHFLHSNLL